MYEKIISDKINRCLILEDEAKFDVDFFNKLNEIEKNILQDFDILFLWYHVSYIKKDFNEYYFKPDKVYGLFGYIVSYQGAKNC